MELLDFLKLITDAGPLGVAGLTFYFLQVARKDWDAQKTDLKAEVEMERSERIRYRDLHEDVLKSFPTLVKEIESLVRTVQRIAPP